MEQYFVFCINLFPTLFSSWYLDIYLLAVSPSSFILIHAQIILMSISPAPWKWSRLSHTCLSRRITCLAGHVCWYTHNCNNNYVRQQHLNINNITSHFSKHFLDINIIHIIHYIQQFPTLGHVLSGSCWWDRRQSLILRNVSGVNGVHLRCQVWTQCHIKQTNSQHPQDDTRFTRKPTHNWHLQWS